MTNEQIISQIEKFGWKLDENRISPFEFTRLDNNNRCFLIYNRHDRTWKVRKNGDLLYKGIDGNPEDIISRLPDINSVIL